MRLHARTPARVSRHARRARIAARQVAMAAIACACLAQGAAATSAVVAADIAPGSLTVGTVLTAPGGRPSSRYLTVPVTDARGSGAGWSVVVSLTTSDGAARAEHARVALQSVGCERHSTCTPPGDSIAYPLALGLRGEGTRVAGASTGTGMGAQWLRLRLELPAGASAAALTIRVSLTDRP